MFKILLTQTKQKQMERQFKKNVKTNPVSVKEGYGVKGMELELNLIQIQVLGSVYKAILDKKDLLTVEEDALLPFLKIFKDFSLDKNNIWSNFEEETLPSENNMQV
jgi:hypothetical protein